MKILT
jgi:hypothetical protein